MAIGIGMRWWCVCWVWFSKFQSTCLLGLVLQVPIGAFFGFGFGLAGEDVKDLKVRCYTVP